MNALNYRVGTAAYLSLPPKDGVSELLQNARKSGPDPQFVNLAPFIDNSTYPTEMKNGTINVLLDTPFGSLSPVLMNQEEYLH